MENTIQPATAAPVTLENDACARGGAGRRLPPSKTPAEVVDSGKVRIGGGMRLPLCRANERS